MQRQCKACGDPLPEGSHHSRFYHEGCYHERKRANAASAREKAPERHNDYTRKWYINNPIARMLKSAGVRARARGLEFNITAADLTVPTVCPVLGIPLALDCIPKTKDSSPSLDRIDNTKGYVKGNVIVVSFKANRIKADATWQELRRISDFYKDLDNV